MASGGVVRALRAPKAGGQPRSFFDKLNGWAQGEGKPGLGYIVLEGGAGKGPIAKFVTEERLARLKALTGAEDGDAVFFVADKPEGAWKFAGQVRTKVGQELGVIAEDEFRFCWIVDFPMFEYDDKAKKIDFSHNPFSMPQGGLEALETQDPLTIKAWQYDIVCNGIELCSGAIRNHRPEIMFKAFGIAGYSAEEVEHRFGGMLNAFRYGAPPHGGAAPGGRPHRHAAGRRAQHPRGHLLPDEPAGGRPDDGRADRTATGEAARVAHRLAAAAPKEGLGVVAKVQID